jgi:hypothetical protein
MTMFNARNKLDVRKGSDAAMVSAIVSESSGKTSLVVGA